MKKQAICMTLSCLFVASAHAQNSVTLYVVIDEGFDYTNNVNGTHGANLTS
jgi:predicted porin